jgi:hypothetical protein
MNQQHNQHILQIQTDTDLSLIEVRLGHIVSQTHALVVTMQPRVITTGLVRYTWDVYSMMQMSWTTITMTLDTAVVIVAAVLGVQHHPAVTKYWSLTTGKNTTKKQRNKQTNKHTAKWTPIGNMLRFACNIMIY